MTLGRSALTNRPGFLARPFTVIISRWSKIMKSQTTILTTVVMIVIATFIAILQFDSSIDKTISACANVFGNARKYKTLTFKVIFPATGVNVRLMAIEPYYIRAEEPDG
jgi:hypothetical protein